MGLRREMGGMREGRDKNPNFGKKIKKGKGCLVASSLGI